MEHKYHNITSGIRCSWSEQEKHGLGLSKKSIFVTVVNKVFIRDYYLSRFFFYQLNLFFLTKSKCSSF